MYIVKVLLVILDILLDHNNKKKKYMLSGTGAGAGAGAGSRKKIPKATKKAGSETPPCRYWICQIR